jgi:hypothetical protein
VSQQVTDPTIPADPPFDRPPPVADGGTVERHGCRLSKVYGDPSSEDFRSRFPGQPTSRDVRANLFRRGVIAPEEPAIRLIAKIALALCSLLALIGLGGSDEDAGTGVLLLMVGVAGVVWGLWILLAKTDLYLPAARPDLLSPLVDDAIAASDQIVLDYLRYDADEDIRARAKFGSGYGVPLDEVVVHPNGRVQMARTRKAPGWVSWQMPTGRWVTLCKRYDIHHVFANAMGITSVVARYDVVDDDQPVPRVVGSDRWLWPAIENLRVGDRVLTIETVGGKRFDLSYVVDDQRRPVSLPSPATDEAGSPDPRSNGASDTAVAMWLERDIEETVAEMLEHARREALTFVNTVNTLREEWIAGMSTSNSA